MCVTLPVPAGIRLPALTQILCESIIAFRLIIPFCQSLSYPKSISTNTYLAPTLCWHKGQRPQLSASGPSPWRFWGGKEKEWQGEGKPTPCGTHQKALASLGLLSAALESFWEGSSSNTAHSPGGGPSFVHILTQPHVQKHPLCPEPPHDLLPVPSVQATTPEGQGLDRAQHQPAAPHCPAYKKRG